VFVSHSTAQLTADTIALQPPTLPALATPWDPTALPTIRTTLPMPVLQTPSLPPTLPAFESASSLPALTELNRWATVNLYVQTRGRVAAMADADAFVLTAWLAVLGAALVLLMRKPPVRRGTPAKNHNAVLVIPARRFGNPGRSECPSRPVDITKTALWNGVRR
jgi:hypothetical protein